MTEDARELYEKMVSEVPYKTDDFQYIGKNTPRFDAVAKVRGEADFSTDTMLPGMLYGKVMRSPYAHARIKSIDVSKAKALPGVHAVITLDDDDVNDIDPRELVAPWDLGWVGKGWEEAVFAEPVLAREVWRAWEQCGAAVAAESRILPKRRSISSKLNGRCCRTTLKWRTRLILKRPALLKETS